MIESWRWMSRRDVSYKGCQRVKVRKGWLGQAPDNLVEPQSGIRDQGRRCMAGSPSKVEFESGLIKVSQEI